MSNKLEVGDIVISKSPEEITKMGFTVRNRHYKGAMRVIFVASNGYVKIESISTGETLVGGQTPRRFIKIA